MLLITIGNKLLNSVAFDNKLVCTSVAAKTQFMEILTEIILGGDAIFGENSFRHFRDICGS